MWIDGVVLWILLNMAIIAVFMFLLSGMDNLFVVLKKK